MRKKVRIVVLALFCIGCPLSVQARDDGALPSRENFFLFLLAGQSNMAGRGAVEATDRIPHPRVLALDKAGKWVPAVAPIHFDKPVAGVGLASAFAETIADKYPGVTIGLIPAACGGSPISSWEPGGYHGQTKSHPWDDAIARSRIAMRDGVLKGILWHQGESDAKAGLAEVYELKLSDLFQRFRKALGTPDVPIVLGQLGRFADNPWNEYRERINEAHLEVARTLPHVAFVRSNGLTPKSDNVHFDTKSLRIFGQRYAEAYLRISE